MPRQFGKIDSSVRWPPCPHCRRMHVPGSLCPPVGVWLVLALCAKCDLGKERYCSWHRDRTVVPVREEMHALPDIEDDEKGAA